MPTLTRTDSVVAKRQLPAEKEVIAGWILGGNHSVKGNEQFLGYMHTIIQYRTISSKCKGLNKSLTTLSVRAIKTSKEIEIKSCFVQCLLSVSCPSSAIL